MAVPCCFCMKEFPTWSSAATSHIASHVKVKSIRCVECSLSFATKETLMSHVHGCHNRLPEGICIDVSIENHERRYLQCKSGLLPDSDDALHSSKVSDTEEQWDNSERTQDSRNVNYTESVTCNPSITQCDGMKTASKRCTISDIDAVEYNSSHISSERSISPVSETDNIDRSSTDLSVTKTSRRKSRKPSQVVISNSGCSEIVCATDCSWVEIVAATQPMTVRCHQCTFTCNTEMQLKVQFICKHYFDNWCVAVYL